MTSLVQICWDFSVRYGRIMILIKMKERETSAFFFLKANLKLFSPNSNKLHIGILISFFFIPKKSNPHTLTPNCLDQLIRLLINQPALKHLIVHFLSIQKRVSVLF